MSAFEIGDCRPPQPAMNRSGKQDLVCTLEIFELYIVVDLCGNTVGITLNQGPRFESLTAHQSKWALPEHRKRRLIFDQLIYARTPLFRSKCAGATSTGGKGAPPFFLRWASASHSTRPANDPYELQGPMIAKARPRSNTSARLHARPYHKRRDY